MFNNNLCRSCGLIYNSVVSIFTHRIESELLTDILFYCTSLEISETDHLPSVLCTKCLEILLKFYKFKKQYLDNNQLFKQKMELANNERDEETDISVDDSMKELENRPLPIKKTEKYLCHLCGNLFTKSSSLLNHLHIHTNTKQFKCTHCPQSFITNSQLSIHFRTHSGLKIHKCETCEKTFTKLSNLKIHTNIHSGTKPFICTQCEKCFSQQQHLLNHQKTHTEERRFKCQQCGFGCITKYHLNKHLISHAGVKNYLCNICGKAYLVQSDLNRHTLVHAGKKYKCEWCSVYFTQLSSFQRHKRKCNHKKS